MFICSECGAELSRGSPRGTCVRCLFTLGLQPDAASELAGSTLLEAPRRWGDFELLEELARGGMGIVFRARQTSLDRVVALKMILDGQFATQEQALRFRAEAEAAARLRHPNIVAIFETGAVERQPFIAMEYVPGGNLSSLVRNGPVPPQRAAVLVKLISEAINYAHGQGLLHRDLKPSNILLDENGQPHITDFGLARRFEKDSFLTVTGQVLGSPNFMPPEQAGAKSIKAGRHSDVYALGGILFYLVTGRPPFVSESVAATLQQVLGADAVSPRLLNPAVPLDVATICQKCLEKDPGKRFSTAQELADELGRFLRDEPIRSRPLTGLARGWRWCRREPALASTLSLGSLLLMVLAIGGPLQAWRLDHAQRIAQENLYIANLRQANELLEAHDPSGAKAALARIGQSADQRAMRGWEWHYVTNRARSDELATPIRHGLSIADLAASPDGRWLATISDDGVAVLWDCVRRKEAARWPAHSQVLRKAPDSWGHALVFTPESSMLITSGMDQRICFWNVPSLTERSPPITLPFPLPRLALSPDGSLLAGQGFGQHVWLWRLSDQGVQQLAQISTDSSVGCGCIFAPGDILLVGWVGEPIARYDISDPEFPKLLPPLANTAAPFALSSTGDTLVTVGSSRRSVQVWRWPEMTSISRLFVRGGSVDAFAFAPVGPSIAAGLRNGQINIWHDQKAGEPAVLSGHDSAVTAITYVANERETHLATASIDQTVRFWESSGTRRVDGWALETEAPVLALALSPDGKYLATAARDSQIPAAGTPSMPYALSIWDVKSRARLRSVAFGFNGKSPRLLFSPGGDVIAATDYSKLAFFDSPFLNANVVAGNRAPIFGPDGWVAYVEGPTGVVRRASLSSPGTVLIDSQDVIRLAVSPDGALLASSDSKGAVFLWNAHNGTKLAEFSGHQWRVVALPFSPDGQLLASASWDGRLGLWDVKRRRNIAYLRGHNGALLCAAFSPDGRTVATGGEDDKVRLWNVARRQEVLLLHGHTDSVTDLAFTADGEWLASASEDGTVRFWHAPAPPEPGKVH